MKKLEKYLNECRGRRVALARELKIRPGAISQWRKVPAERVVAVEKFTGVSRLDLRPDLYCLNPASKEQSNA